MGITDGLKLVGKGSFSKCYLLNDKEVIIISDDPIKECMAMGWFPDSRFFPEVERVLYKDDWYYKMKYYPRTPSLKQNLTTFDWNLYKELRALKAPYCINKAHLKSEWHKIFQKVSHKPLREALLAALQGCSNYGEDVCFEISPKNVRTHNGKLILLDCFFIQSKLAETLKPITYF